MMVHKYVLVGCEITYQAGEVSCMDRSLYKLRLAGCSQSPMSAKNMCFWACG